MTTAQRIAHRSVQPDQVAVFWLGQAGFVFKDETGFLTAVDLYLSDCCYRYFGMRRIMPAPLSPAELEFDVVIATHAHYDHFDPDAMPWLMAGERTHLITAVDGLPLAEQLRLPMDRVIPLRVGDRIMRSTVDIQAVPCDHGEGTPDAVGLLLTIGGKRIYITGDTNLHLEWADRPELQGLDLLILPINGAYGNLNEQEAAQLAARLKPRLTMPCHFWNFVEHGGNPQIFGQWMQKYAPNQPWTVLQIGTDITI
jgi:L-ascorbate 6-phosphate lactonase